MRARKRVDVMALAVINDPYNVLLTALSRFLTSHQNSALISH